MTGGRRLVGSHWLVVGSKRGVEWVIGWAAPGWLSWLVGGVVGRLVVGLAGSLAGWPVGRRGRFVGLVAAWSAGIFGWMADWLADWLDGCLDLVGCLAGELAAGGFAVRFALAVGSSH